MKDDAAHLIDILEAAKLIRGYIQDKTIYDLYADTEKQDAVVRRFEIIGEAANRVSMETQNKYPELPWRDMIDMRNILIHDYDDVDLSIVWNTATNDLPTLITQIEKIVTR